MASLTWPWWQPTLGITETDLVGTCALFGTVGLPMNKAVMILYTCMS